VDYHGLINEVFPDQQTMLDAVLEIARRNASMLQPNEINEAFGVSA